MRITLKEEPNDVRLLSVWRADERFSELPGLLSV
jgi:hypothetical protein